MITRKSLADEIDVYDQSIADMNAGKKDCFDAYRDQMLAAGVAKPNIKKEIEAVKEAIRRRRLVVKDRNAVEEKDKLVDEVLEEITAPSRAPRARVENIEQFPPHNPETGELTDTQEQPETNDEGSRPESQVGRDSAPDASEHGAAARPIHQDHDADRNGLVCGSGPTGDEAGTAVAHSPSPETPQATADEKAAPPAASSAPNPNPQPTSSPGADEAGGVPTPPSPASQFDNPRCKSPDGCTFAHSRNSCFDCTMAWATRPRDEQRKLWQDAVAASETEAAA